MSNITRDTTLGIGANTAIFSAVNALLLNPFPFPEPDRIVSVDAHHVRGKTTTGGAGYRDFLDWRDQNDVFEEMAIVPWTGTYTMGGQGEPQRIIGGDTTVGFLRVLGIQPVMGRFFTAEEDKPGAARVAVLLLFSAVAFVLLLACVNIAGLQLARASGRAQEIAIRASLGAGRGRIVRQMLTESVLGALAGGSLGLVFAQWLMDVLRSTAPKDFLPFAQNPEPYIQINAPPHGSSPTHRHSAPPVLVRPVIDRVVPGRPWNGFWAYSRVIAALLLVSLALVTGSTWLTMRPGNAVGLHLRRTVLRTWGQLICPISQRGESASTSITSQRRALPPPR